MAQARKQVRQKEEILYAASAENLSPLPQKPKPWRKNHAASTVGGRRKPCGKSLKTNEKVPERREVPEAQTIISAARIIQLAFRKYLASRALKQAKAATLLQAVWRGQRRRMLEARWHTAAALVQIRWRQFRKRHLQSASAANAALVLQSVWRGRRVRQWYACEMRALRAAVVLQSAWRGREARLWYTVEMRALRAAVVLQSAWRGREVRLWYRQVAEVRSRASKKIQECWRAHAAAKRNNAAELLQAVWKGRRARMQRSAAVRAAVVIQKAFRAKYGTILKERRAAVTLQAHWRGRCQRVQYIELWSAVVALQKTTRGWLARKDASIARRAKRFFALANKDYAIRTKAASVFQKVWHGRKARIRIRHWNTAATFLQIQVRLWLCVWRKCSKKDKVLRRNRAVADAVHDRKWRKRLAVQACISNRFPVVTSRAFATLGFKTLAIQTVLGYANTVERLKVLKKNPKKVACNAANAADKSMRAAVKAGGDAIRFKIRMLYVESSL